MQRLQSMLGGNRLFRALTHPYTRRALRVGRTVAIAGALVGTGYATGMHDAIDDPEGTKRKMLTEILAGQQLMPDAAGEVRLVSRLGQELVLAAQTLLAAELEEAQAKARQGGALTAEQQAAAASPQHKHMLTDEMTLTPSSSDANEELEHLAKKLRAMHRDWRFVVIDNDTVNAFVTDALPGVVFVHRGLVKLYAKKPDQLAFILGHELSHYLLEHGTQDRNMGVGISMMQLAFLAAVDPTGAPSHGSSPGHSVP